MGKPSSTHIPKKKNNRSRSSSKKRTTMSNTHFDYVKKCRRTKKTINKLFENLRNMSNTLNETDNSVLILDDTQNPGQSRPKRKLSECDSSLDGDRQSKHALSDCVISESKRFKNDTITITDEDDVLITGCQLVDTNTPRKCVNPMKCSTPIPKTSVIRIENPNETKEINEESFVTIDLTTESVLKNASNSHANVIIDLADTTDNKDCTVVSVSNASLSISGESDVTVLENKSKKSSKGMRKFVNKISRMNASEKGRLLDMITQNIFSGCNMSNKLKNQHPHVKVNVSQATDTVEDTYIKEVILGQAQSRNSIGSNIYNPEQDVNNKKGLRMIVIDGSNVAMEHDKGRVFSVKALKICIDYFLKRGHVVKAFVPRFRCKFGMSSDPRLLDDLERQGLVVYTPSREIQGRRVCSYDDRYIVQCAAEFDGVIVSGDNYRDLINENPRWRHVIENRVLPFTWVNDMIMFPRDPLGRNGPTLDCFLRHPSVPSNSV